MKVHWNERGKIKKQQFFPLIYSLSNKFKRMWNENKNRLSIKIRKKEKKI